MQDGEAGGVVVDRTADSASPLERIARALGIGVDTFYDRPTEREASRCAAEQRRALLLAFDRLADPEARERCVRYAEAEVDLVPATGPDER